ncbi:MAG: PHP domain-containing protein [Firmicutes bacterium]|nr:PHP domain-containing protein [Bacillota bacterium]
MLIRADYHFHSDYSDGEFSPAGLVQRCQRLGLEGASLTDHDGFAGSLLFLEEAAKLCSPNIKAVLGMELSASYGGSEIHILGYGFDKDCPDILKFCREVAAERLERADYMALKLSGFGFTVDRSRLDDAKGTVGRAHVARAVTNADDSYAIMREYLCEGGSCHPGLYKTEAARAVETVRRAGGIAVLAHPSRIRCGAAALLPALAEAGLGGIEYFYPGQDTAFWKTVDPFVEKYGLLRTGGSDMHCREPEHSFLSECICV